MTESILYTKDGNIEFWTIKATGESAMSLRGTARMCGKRLSTIQNLLKLIENASLTDGKLSKTLKPFAEKDLYLTTKNEGIVKNGKTIDAIKAAVANAIIQHYAFSGCETAQETLVAIGEIGLNSYIQAKTGWLPEVYQSSKVARSLADHILNDPKQWTLHFDTEWQQEAMRVTGYRWLACLPMAQFISQFIYQALPKDMYAKLLTVNPERKKKHHQFFADDADELVLKRHIQRVYGLMLASQNKEQFKKLFNNAFSDGIQIELEFPVC